MKPHFTILLSMVFLFLGVGRCRIVARRNDFGLSCEARRTTCHHGCYSQPDRAGTGQGIGRERYVGPRSARFFRFADRSSEVSGRAAENIAYGYDSFEQTPDQWIASTGHRKNLSLRNASRAGVASARSASSHRMYWAMEIADESEPLRRAASKTTPPAAKTKITCTALPGKNS